MKLATSGTEFAKQLLVYCILHCRVGYCFPCAMFRVMFSVLVAQILCLLPKVKP